MSDTLANITSKSTSAIRAYLGGSFNPVHHGHIEMAMAVYNTLAPIANEQQRALHVYLLPNARSPFKEQSTDPKHRLAMLKLAVVDTPLQIEELELWQTPPVYSIDSVRALRQYYPDDSLIFIMGMDSARSLEQWKEGLQLINYVHLWIFNRNANLNSAAVAKPESRSYPNNQLAELSIFSDHTVASLSNELPTQLQAQVTGTPIELTQPLHVLSPLNKPLTEDPLLKSISQGCIYIDSRSISAISSTQIRKQLQADDTTTNNECNNLPKCLNPAVYQYIIAHQLYSAV